MHSCRQSWTEEDVDARHAHKCSTCVTVSLSINQAFTFHTTCAVMQRKSSSQWHSNTRKIWGEKKLCAFSEKRIKICIRRIDVFIFSANFSRKPVVKLSIKIGESNRNVDFLASIYQYKPLWEHT